MIFSFDIIGLMGLLAVLLAAASACYLALAFARTLLFLPRCVEPRGELPAVCLFKPVRGANERLYENLRSYCVQLYPCYQVIFGVRDSSDPAYPVIERLVSEFPGLDIKVSIGWDESAQNPKVATLLPMEDLADHDIWVIADSDTRVEPDFLSAVVREFDDRRVGAVTCLYTVDTAGSAIPRFGAMGINEWFLPSVLVAETIGPLKYCFGATMAIRRQVLDEFGGLRMLADNLADDYMLGQLVHQAGYRVALARVLVKTEVPEKGLRSLWTYELRWARTIRSVQPAGYIGSFLTYGVPISLIALVLTSASALSLVLLFLVLALRLGIHYAVRRFLGARDSIVPYLIPARDFFGFFVWLAGFARRTVDWRGVRYRVETGGRMTVVEKR